MYIMTVFGWKQLAPRHCEPAGHTPSLLELIGADHNYDAVVTMADYCNGSGRGVYFTYRSDGTAYQSRAAINPLPGMYGEG